MLSAQLAAKRSTGNCSAQSLQTPRKYYTIYQKVIQRLGLPCSVYTCCLWEIFKKASLMVTLQNSAFRRALSRCFPNLRSCLHSVMSPLFFFWRCEAPVSICSTTYFIQLSNAQFLKVFVQMHCCGWQLATRQPYIFAVGTKYVG